MKNGNIIFQVALAIAVVVLFALHFTGGNDTSAKPSASSTSTESAAPKGNIVYVRMDSLLNNYQLHTRYMTSLSAKEQRLRQDLAKREENVLIERQTLQQAAPSLTPTQLRTAQNEYQRIEQAYLTYQQTKMAELQLENDSLMKIVKDDIDQSIADLQTEMGFDYVLQYQGTLLYGDSLADITTQLVQRLNAKDNASTSSEE
ncbi:MAG: OmpH family outer membrane protein [Bacteroidetes bacterium]|nr:MAG: OmpH family outer membrane protein [Bacteroidota bacterium]